MVKIFSNVEACRGNKKWEAVRMNKDVWIWPDIDWLTWWSWCVCVCLFAWLTKWSWVSEWVTEGEGRMLKMLSCVSLVPHWHHHVVVEWCSGFDQHSLNRSQFVFGVCFSQGKQKNMNVVLLEGRFLQVSNWAYLKWPQLGATEACVFDLLRRRMEPSCRATTQAFILWNGNPGLLLQLYLNTRFPYASAFYFQDVALVLWLLVMS